MKKHETAVLGAFSAALKESGMKLSGIDIFDALSSTCPEESILVTLPRATYKKWVKAFILVNGGYGLNPLIYSEDEVFDEDLLNEQLENFIRVHKAVLVALEV